MSSRIKGVILDDEESSVYNLKTLINDFYPMVDIVDTALSLEDFDSMLKKKNFNIAFLDVQIGSESIFDY